MIKVCLYGASGKMGHSFISESLKDGEVEVTNFIVKSDSKFSNVDLGKDFEELKGKKYSSSPHEAFDLIVDFATADDVFGRIENFKSLKKPVIFCSTGVSDADILTLKNLSSEIPIFIAPNTSIYIGLIQNFLKKLSRMPFNHEIKITEKHHESKKDQPSGTAVELADNLNAEKESIESIREGNDGNWHKIQLISDLEELELTHIASNRTIYAQGALKIVKWFYQKPKNLYYMQTLIEDLYE
ncbi:MAG: hypothetical protein CMQ58_01790 [Gammaproteobacteria bacterium]|nr:hypothetical protein [Gammaproteobacteria bacterium]|tara:strand:+ start:11218 stop:11943 length:726 start_codon:yes stop_codon:yes gene_type:complete